MRILAIETSCDETAIAIADFRGVRAKTNIRILSHLVSSQVKLHAKFGGVVPNLAKREHQKNLVPLLASALKESGLWKQEPKGKRIPKAQFKILNSILEREPELLRRLKTHILPLQPPAIDAIAVTYGPGLAPALWVGVNCAKALASLWRKPLIPVDHMAGHLYSALLETADHEWRIAPVALPALPLLVSGGHTELVLMREHGRFKIIGETVDDAAGEAFDKVARILGLRYPGGPEIAREAAKCKVKSFKLRVELPRPMIHSKDFNFSFSGLKTAVLYLVRELKGKYPLAQIRPAVAKEFQNAVVEVLVKKTVGAAKEHRVRSILLGGGVAANAKLRQELKRAVAAALPATTCFFAPLEFTGDNALMIALAAYFAGKEAAPTRVGAEANLRLS